MSGGKMKEYNWREEREKYRTDLKAEKPASEPEKAPNEPAPRRSFKVWYFAGGAILLAALIVAGLAVCKMLKKPQPQKDSLTMLVEAAEKHKSAVGVVVVTVELKNGAKYSDPIGTAWAFSENKFATNGHVAIGLKGYYKGLVIKILTEDAKQNGYQSLEAYWKSLTPAKQKAVYQNAYQRFINMLKDVRVDIIINSSHKKSYTVTQVQAHKDYGVQGTSFNPDVAVLTIDGKHDNYFKIADKETLENLKPGTPIAFLGFPMENLEKGNINIDNPIASMQTGNIVAVSDFDMKDAGKGGNFLLRHNLPATGGASGSPIFNVNGEVIALLYAGNIIGQVSSNGNITRAPSAAQINFGVRVDLINGMGEAEPIKKFLNLEQ